MNVLQQICVDKKEHVASQRKERSENDLLATIADMKEAPRGFSAAMHSFLKRQQSALIAEIKHASPSKGVLRNDFVPADIAKAYEEGGAVCLSVLTDVPYFKGDDQYISQVKQVSKLPVLRKDFMLDPYQIIESRAIGADAVLLILSALDDVQAKELEMAALELGMDVLIETHDAYELERACTHLSSPLLGINNRNLKTLNIDIKTSVSLASMAPKDRVVVSESGIETSADIRYLNGCGIYAFLVGSSLMVQPDIKRATMDLLG